MFCIGSKIKKELVNQQKSVQWLAAQCGCSRMTIYRMLEKNSIDTNMLSHICRALNHNFFTDLAVDVDNYLTDADCNNVSNM